MKCKVCSGTGRIESGVKCYKCNGYGRELNRLGRIKQRDECEKCCGFGKLERATLLNGCRCPAVERIMCPECGGSGKTVQP